MKCQPSVSTLAAEIPRTFETVAKRAVSALAQGFEIELITWTNGSGIRLIIETTAPNEAPADSQWGSGQLVVAAVQHLGSGGGGARRGEESAAGGS